MGLAADRTGIQFRQLNASKGQAVRSSRCQSDRKQYKLYMQDVVKRQVNLSVLEGKVGELLVRGSQITGIVMEDGKQILIAINKIDGVSGARIGIEADKSIQIRKAETLKFADFGNGERRAFVPKR